MMAEVIPAARRMGIYSRHILPRILDFAMRRESLGPLRREVLAELAGDVLEIGFGSGLNLPFYPPAVRRLTAVEPSEGMSKRARARLEEAEIEVTTLGLDAASRLPLADGSFDAAVSTWTLCSIADVAAALREVHRVLRPGGRLFFIEHGLAPDAKVARWQHRLTPLNRRLAGGCHLDRDIAALVRASPLSVERCDTFYLPGAPKVGGFLYRGAARKA
jgi:ubiquinone/menaquinone biosynthesis C-methylase UbiE